MFHHLKRLLVTDFLHYSLTTLHLRHFVEVLHSGPAAQIHQNHFYRFIQAKCPSCRPTHSVTAPGERTQSNRWMWQLTQYSSWNHYYFLQRRSWNAAEWMTWRQMYSLEMTTPTTHSYQRHTMTYFLKQVLPLVRCVVSWSRLNSNINSRAVCRYALLHTFFM